MRFFNLDLHVAVVADLARIFAALGHTVDSVNMSGHNWVFGRGQAATDVVTAQNWMQIGPAMCDAFHARYKDELASYDAFVVTYPPVFALLFEKWHKPVIVVAATRYEAPFMGNPGRWNWFDERLRAGVDEGRIHLLANNRYDAAYGEHFLQRPFTHIPSLCEYTGVSYAPSQDTFAWYSRFDGHPELAAAGGMPLARPFRQRYAWSDLMRHRGVVAVPHNVSTMSLFEFYAQAVPMFFPTPGFMLDLRRKFPGGVLEEMSWNQVFRLPPVSAIAGTSSRPDPNAYADPARIAQWLPLADFYDDRWMPHLRYFGSWEELRRMLATLTDQELGETSARMAAFQVERRRQVHALWEQVLRRVS